MKTWHQFVRAGLGEITQKRCLTRASELSEIMAEEWRVKSKLAYKITPGRSAPPRLLWNRHVQESAHRVDDLWESCLGTGPAGVEPSHQVWKCSPAALTVHVSLCVQDPGHQARTFHPPVLTWTMLALSVSRRQQFCAWPRTKLFSVQVIKCIYQPFPRKCHSEKEKSWGKEIDVTGR